MDGLPLDRPRPDERDLDREVVDRLGLRAEEALHLRAALDLEDADRVRRLDLREDRGIVERDPGEVDRRAVQLGDPVDALLDAREHPEPEQVDLEEPRVGARVLVPLAELAAGHGRGLDGDEFDERPRGDHHPSRVLGDVPRQPGDLPCQEPERAPALREELPVGVGELRHLVSDPFGAPAVGDAREPLELGVRQPERLAHVADRAAGAVRREARDEGRVLVPVALGDAHDELLADVAREVEVDVGHRGELLVEEAAEREVVLDGIDVREPGQVADDRPDRATAAPPRRQVHPGRVATAHLERALAGELEHLVVEEEEAGEAEPPDQRELALQASAGTTLQQTVASVVPRAESVGADRGELLGRGVGAVGEVGVAVTELRGEVERQSLGELDRALGGGTIDPGEALDHLVRRAKDGLAVATALALAPVERGAAADRDERVLEKRAPRGVGMDVPRRDRLDAEMLGKVAKRGVSSHVAALVRALQLDEEPLPPERGGEPSRAMRVTKRQPVTGTAGEADETLVQLRDGLERHLGLEQHSMLLALGPRPRMSGGQDPAEVGVAAARLDEERQV